MPTVLIFFIFC